MALAVTGGIIVGAVSLSSHAHRPSAAPTDAAKLSTATVTRKDLSDSRTLAGTLGFGAATPVKGAGTGLVTDLPAPGKVVVRGRPLYSVNEQPVVVFYGGTPLFRTLEPAGMPGKPGGTQEPDAPGEPGGTHEPDKPPRPELRGRDVTVVADNLRALGYDIGPRRAASTGGKDSGGQGDVYTASLSAAVKRWQRYIGMKPTGTLGVGQIVVVPGPVRVSALQVQLGDPATGPLLSVTPTEKTVTVPVGATETDGIETGTGVTITLPSAATIDGTIRGIGQTVQDGATGPGGQDTPPSLNITVAPKKLSEVGNLTAAPVQVTFTTNTRKGVLTVPVGALVALGEGGYALQRTDGTLVGVTTGLFANGLVEISGDGVRAGLRVETSS